MVVDKKLETMQEELKLLKGELKQSLASVRDYLLNMELPASEFSNILEALDSGEGQKVTMSGSLGTPAENKPTEEAQPETIEPEPETLSADENLIDLEEPLVDESDVLEEEGDDGQDEEPAIEETVFTRDEIDEEEQPEVPGTPENIPGLDAALPLAENLAVDFEEVSGEAGLATPKVNMLANLINWVARAKKEIGYDQLPTFLEVYGISGHLSLELKEVIMQLAQITAERPEVANDPEIWSESMLTLHGILTGGEAPLHPVLPFSTDTAEEIPPDEEGEEVAEETPEEPPMKLKLVLPTGNGKTREYCISLTPEEEKPEDDKVEETKPEGAKPKEAKSEVAPRRGKK